MNKYWLRLGRSDAISRVTVIVVVLLQTSGGLLTSIVNISGRVPEYLSIRAAALGTIFLILGLGKLILRSSLRFEFKPVVTVLIFITASTMNVFVDDSLLVITHLIPESRFLTRLGIAIYGLPIAMIATALIVSQLREYGAKNQKLSEIEQSLRTSRADAENLLASRKAELIERIEKEISRGISSINTHNSNLSSQEMKTLLDDVVRPLSYQLDREVPSISLDSSEPIEPKIKWREVFFSTVNDANPFHPLATVAWPTLTATTFITATFGAIGLLSGALFFTIFFTGTWIAKKIWHLFPSRISTFAKALLITSIYATTAWAASIAIALPANGLLLANGKTISWIIFMVIIAWSVAVLFTANRLLKNATKQLERTNEELKREVIAMNYSLRQLQRGISRVLHGPVQQAIAASIFKLQTTPERLTDPLVIHDIQQRISDALAQLKDAEVSSRDLVKSFDEIVELWSGVSDISLNISNEDLSLIQVSPQTTATVYELVSEACVNAIKHSEPSYINISITTDKDLQQILILKTCDGKPLSESQNSGLGTQLLDEMCLSWKRNQQGDEVALEMHVPLYDS